MERNKLCSKDRRRMLKSHRKTVLETLGRGTIHPFPARMAPGIALEALGKGGTPLRVLDPMAGSGTVLAVARANGHKAIGIDLDPLAVLLSNVWTKTVNAEGVRDKATRLLEKARRSFQTLRSAEAYPAGGDDETRRFIRYWFDDYARRQLAALAGAINKVRDEATRNVLWCAFSRLIITKNAGASLAMDLSHSRPHKQFSRAPVKPFNRFLVAVETVVSNCPQPTSGAVGPIASVKQGDARNLKLDDNSIDLVLTSPPYLNAIDYMRCSKFSLVWMGYTVSEIRQLRGDSIGAEVASKEALDTEWVKSIIKELRLSPSLSNRDHNLLARYTWDIGHAVGEAARVLRRGGRAVYVVGDCRSRGTFIRNSKILTLLAERHGLSLMWRQCRSLPANRRYMPPPKQSTSVELMDGRMRREVVLAFKKS
jgi:hypothetical protein